jgi:hypothetical protein
LEGKRGATKKTKTVQKVARLLIKTSPFVLSERVGVDNFIVINQEDMTPLSENASIESETPRYFQVDNLYRIDAAKSLS